MIRSVAYAAISLSVLASAAGAQPLPRPIGIPQSVGVQLKQNNLDAANLDRIKAAGFKVVRRGFLWSVVEKEPGVYDFSIYDQLVANCRERGLKLIGTIALGNEKLYGHVKDLRGREAYAAYAAKLAERYKGQDILWEIWNEPNVATFWGKHGKHNSEPYAEEYTNLVKAAVPAMKQADPGCFIMAGSVSNLWSASYQWQEYVFAKGILKTGIDAWSVHPYGLSSPEEYIEAYATVRKLMKDSGHEPLVLINSERGFTTAGKGEGDVGGIAALRAEYQAWHFVRQQLIDLLEGVPLTIWYEWSGGEGFSLSDKGSETPALKAARVLLKALDGYTFDKRHDLGAERDFVLEFKNGAGDVKLVCWTAPPSKQSPDKTVDHDITLPVNGTHLTTIYGETTPLSGNKIRLTGAPVYVKVK